MKTQTIISLIRLFMIHPKLMYLAWSIKRSGKTYLSISRLTSLVESFKVVQNRQSRKLNLAEFGVGRGGSATILSWLVNYYGGNLTLFDLFAFIPAPSDLDGERAQAYYAKQTSWRDPTYYGNVPNLFETVRKEISMVCPLDRVTFIPGRYEETLKLRSDDEKFDLVHIDCDWYESIRAVLNYLESHLNSGAILQIDDYMYWDGTKRVIDETEWLSPYRRKLVDHALVIDTGQYI